MKPKEEILKIINNYNELIELAKKKIEVLEIIDKGRFNTSKGIEKVSFYDDMVDVICDDSCRGCYDSLSFSFPIYYLSLTDDELMITVQHEKEERIKKEVAEKEKKELKEKNDKEQKDLELYNKLKEKYENRHF